MSNDELRSLIYEQTGIPPALLVGDTQKEIFSTAGKLLEFRHSSAPKPDRTTAEQFADWILAQDDDFVRPKASDDMAALERIRYSLRPFPDVPDGGETEHPDGRTTAEQFAEWFNRVSAFSPRAGGADFLGK